MNRTVTLNPGSYQSDFEQMEGQSIEGVTIPGSNWSFVDTNNLKLRRAWLEHEEYVTLVFFNGSKISARELIVMYQIDE